MSYFRCWSFPSTAELLRWARDGSPAVVLLSFCLCFEFPTPFRPIHWWTGRLGTARAAPSSWDCCSCRFAPAEQGWVPLAALCVGFQPPPPHPQTGDGPGASHPIPYCPLSRWQEAEEGVCVLLCPQMPEEEAFCVFVRLMQEYRLRELFKPSMAELGLCIYQFEYMLQVSAARGSPECCSSPWGRGPGEG